MNPSDWSESMTITRDKLLTLEAYAKIRNSSKPGAIAHRRLRRRRDQRLGRCCRSRRSR